MIRSYWTYVRANARLATAVAGRRDRRALIGAAAKDGAALIREGVPWAVGLGELVLANVATAHGDRARAFVHAKRAGDALARAGLSFYSLAARYLHGWALGGERGDSIREAVRREAQSAGVRAPRRVVLMFAPALDAARLRLIGPGRPRAWSRGPSEGWSPRRAPRSSGPGAQVAVAARGIVAPAAERRPQIIAPTPPWRIRRSSCSAGAFGQSTSWGLAASA